MGGGQSTRVVVRFVGWLAVACQQTRPSHQDSQSSIHRLSRASSTRGWRRDAPKKWPCRCCSQPADTRAPPLSSAFAALARPPASRRRRSSSSLADTPTSRLSCVCAVSHQTAISHVAGSLVEKPSPTRSSSGLMRARHTSTAVVGGRCRSSARRTFGGLLVVETRASTSARASRVEWPLEPRAFFIAFRSGGRGVWHSPFAGRHLATRRDRRCRACQLTASLIVGGNAMVSR